MKAAFISPVPELVRPRLLHPCSRTRPRFQMTVSATSLEPKPSLPLPSDPSQITVEDFFQRSFGTWRAQRSSHTLAWGQYEQVSSIMEIIDIGSEGDGGVEVLEEKIKREGEVVARVKMSWRGESDWDEGEDSEGECVMVVVKRAGNDREGLLIRSIGYAEKLPAVGEWRLTQDGVFVLDTKYEAASAEERIWFATPDLRMRVSQIRTSSGKGVVTASLSTEIRKLHIG